MNSENYYPIHTIKTIKEMIYLSKEKFGKRTAFQDKVGQDWINTSFNDFLSMSESIACGLSDKGLKKGDKVAIIGKNRIQWCAVYMACAISGLIAVPLDRELKEQELYYTLHQSEAPCIVCSDEYVDVIFYIIKQLPKLKYVVSMDDKKRDNLINLSSIIQSGKKLIENGKTQALNRDITPDTILSMLFTSGTTGISKIVPLTHKNLCANIMSTCRYVYFDENDKWLSVLPVHHVYECTCGFLIPLYKGAGIAFAESLYKLADNAKEVKPTVMLGVPALYESILKKILSTIKSKKLGSFKLSLALKICKFYKSLTKKNIGEKVFKELHEKFGGSFRILITGGAAANPEVSLMYNQLGFKFFQGAGMTEISPIYALNPDWYYKHASIGIPLPGEQLKILDPDRNGIGEIAVKGDSVFNGYLNAPEINKECFIDGWFRTGDMGYKDDEGYYFITGRMKNVIVTSGGKNIYPEEIENWLNKSPFILESLVWGGPESHKNNEDVHAIIVPDLEYLDRHFLIHNVIKNEAEIKKIIAREIKHYCANLAVFKRVKKFQIRNEEFPKTTTKKIKRYLVLSQLSNEADI